LWRPSFLSAITATTKLQRVHQKTGLSELHRNPFPYRIQINFQMANADMPAVMNSNSETYDFEDKANRDDSPVYIKVSLGPVFWWWCMLAFGLLLAWVGPMALMSILIARLFLFFGIIFAVTLGALAIFKKATRLRKQSGVIILPSRNKIVLLGTLPVLLITMGFTVFIAVSDAGSKYLWQDVLDFSLFSLMCTTISGLLAYGFERNQRFEAIQLQCAASHPGTAGAPLRRIVINVSFIAVGLICELAIIAVTFLLLDYLSSRISWKFISDAGMIIPVYSFLLVQAWQHWKILEKDYPGSPRADLASVATSTGIQFFVLFVIASVYLSSLDLN